MALAMLRSPKALTQGVVLGVVVAGTSVATGSASAASPQPATVHLAYTCRPLAAPQGFPAVPQRVGMQLSAVFPAAATAGQALQPTGAKLTVTLPRPLAGYFAQHAASVTATTRTTIDTTQGATKGTAFWPGWARLATVSPTGPLVLRSAGRVPALVPHAPGTLTITAATVLVAITPHAHGPITSQPGHVGGIAPSVNHPPPPTTGPTPPVGSSPSSVQLRCTPDAHQTVMLAAVTVSSGPGGSSGGTVRHRARFPCPKQPPGFLQLNPHFPLPTPPPGSTVTHPPPVPGCAYIIGYANQKKLKCSALVGPGLTNLAQGDRIVLRQKPPTYFESDNAGQLDFKATPTSPVVHGLPPIHVTCLGFGFMPVTATLSLLQVGTTNIYSIGTLSSLTTNIILSNFILRIDAANVNGQNLPVAEPGVHCQTEKPFRLELVGNPHSKPPYSLQGGGPLTGTLNNIPFFKGCGVGEDLNPLFNGTVSGQDVADFNLLTQGSLCTPQGGVCPPNIPKPLRHVREPAKH
ncbi:MAG TPA: DUF6801 domain-containing protein [Streptosporangiaceae bacterium]|nr:DUF6801 domain-containing protein [Streptosporangiaceae bacterium]